MTLVELPMADSCCGFGGTFAIKNADTSTAMLADKMTNVIASGTEVCTAGDSSCLMQIGGGLGRIRSGVRTVHLAEIFAATDKIEQYIESFNSRVRDERLNIKQLLVAGPRPSDHQRLETRLQPPSPTFRPRLPTTEPLRCHLHSSMCVGMRPVG